MSCHRRKDPKESSVDERRLLYDGHLVHDNDTLESLAEHGVDEEEIRAGVRFEMNARRELC